MKLLPEKVIIRHNVISHYESGTTIKDIKSIFNISGYRVYRFLIIHYYNLGLSGPEISKKLNLSYSFIYPIIKAAGIIRFKGNIRRTDGYKKCSICKQFKAPTDFNFSNYTSTNIGSSCKSCHNERNRNKRIDYKNKTKEQKEVILQQNKNSRTKRKNYILLQQAKNRAIKFNLEFTLSIEDIIIPNICPVLGVELKLDNIKLSDNSPTIDRIDNTKGYTKNNIKIISWRANRIKNNSTIEDLLLILNYMKKENKK